MGGREKWKAEKRRGGGGSSAGEREFCRQK